MIIVPDKFVVAHMPKTAGMWIRRHLLDNVPGAFEVNPRHMPVSEIRQRHVGGPVVAVSRDPVDWIESMYAYKHDRDEWKPDENVIDRHPHETIEQWVSALIEHHPGLLSQYAASYLHPADMVFRFETLTDDWSHFLAAHGLPVADPIVRNQSTRSEKIPTGLANQWRLSNALYCEQFGYGLPDGAVYSLGDWSGHWRRTLRRVLAPLLRGRPVSLLEIGVCEGRGAAAAFEILLNHPDSSYVGVDNWSLSPRYRAERNISLISGGRHWLQDADSVAAEFYPAYDVIYIDGDHTHEGCAADLNRWSNRVTSGGFLVIDDYGTDDQPGDYPGVKLATDEWLASNAERWDVIERGYQLILQRNE